MQPLFPQQHFCSVRCFEGDSFEFPTGEVLATGQGDDGGRDRRAERDIVARGNLHRCGLLECGSGSHALCLLDHDVVPWVFNPCIPWFIIL